MLGAGPGLSVCVRRVQELCDEQKIEVFPTVLVYRNGSADIVVGGHHRRNLYEGERTEEAFTPFVNDLVREPHPTINTKTAMKQPRQPQHGCTVWLSCSPCERGCTAAACDSRIPTRMCAMRCRVCSGRGTAARNAQADAFCTASSGSPLQICADMCRYLVIDLVIRFALHPEPGSGYRVIASLRSARIICPAHSRLTSLWRRRWQATSSPRGRPAR